MFERGPPMGTKMEEVEPLQIGTINVPPLIRAGIRGLLDLAGHSLLPVDDIPAWAERHGSGALIVGVQDSDDIGVLFEVLAQVRSTPITIVALIDDSSDDVLWRCIRAGATTCVSMRWNGTELALAIRAAVRGMTLTPQPMLRRLLELAQLPELSLSLADYQVTWLKDMATGMTVAQLAESEGYSEREMYRRLKRLYSELGVANRVEALVLAASAGVLDSPLEDGARQTIAS